MLRRSQTYPVQAAAPRHHTKNTFKCRQAFINLKMAKIRLKIVEKKAKKEQKNRVLPWIEHGASRIVD